MLIISKLLRRLTKRVPSSISVAQAQLEDVEGLLSLLNHHYAHLGRKIEPETNPSHQRLTDPQKYWRDKGGDFWVLKDKDRVIGSLAAQKTEEDRRIADFDWFYLYPEYEGKAYTLLLIEQAAKWLESSGCMSIEFWTGQAHTRAHRLYRRLGFQDTGVHKVIYPKGEPYRLLFFRKTLDIPNDIHPYRQS